MSVNRALFKMVTIGSQSLSYREAVGRVPSAYDRVVQNSVDRCAQCSLLDYWQEKDHANSAFR